MNRLRYYFGEAWRGLWHHRTVTFTSLLALVGALLVPAAFLVLLVNTRDALHTLGDRREMIVFLRDGTADTTWAAIRDTLATRSQSVAYVSKDEAWEEMARELGGSELLEAVGENPLPASLRVKLLPGYLNFDSMDSIATAVAENQAVEEVQFGGQWVRRLDRFIESLRWTATAVAALIALVVLFVVSNTIRLTIVARREIHRVMALVGASGTFVRLPLVLEGMLASTLAAGLALGTIYGIFRLLQPRLAVLPSFLPWSWMLVFCAAAALLGVLGALMALARLAPRGR